MTKRKPLKFTDELYISIDIEADGPCPGVNSMLSLGAAAYDCSGNCLAKWTANFETIPGGVQDENTMTEFWAKHPMAWEACRKDVKDPSEAIKDFIFWVEKTKREHKKKSLACVAYPAGYDWSFVYYYMMRYAKRSPFSFACLDVKSFAMALMKTPYRATAKRSMPTRWFPKDLPHTHIALDDAVEQGKLFCNILEECRWGVPDENKN